MSHLKRVSLEGTTWEEVAQACAEFARRILFVEKAAQDVPEQGKLPFVAPADAPPPVEKREDLEKSAIEAVKGLVRKHGPKALEALLGEFKAESVPALPSDQLRTFTDKAKRRASSEDPGVP